MSKPPLTSFPMADDDDATYHLCLQLDGRKVWSSYASEFSSSGEFSARLGNGGVVMSGARRLQCTMHHGSELCFSLDVPCSASGEDVTDDDDVWLAMPGTRSGRFSLAADVPGFTVCFDASLSQSSSFNNELHCVRIVRQKVIAPMGQSVRESVVRVSDDEGDEDDDDAERSVCEVRELSRSVHGEWARTAVRPGPAVCVWPRALASDESLRALRRDAIALVREHGHGGRTFWIGAKDSPRCALEAMALEVLAFHSTADADAFLGAEWWVQMRAAPLVHGEAACTGDGGDDDESSIAFHFDCDEGLFSATGELVPPWLATITYLSAHGAPTLVLPARADAMGEVVPSDAAVGAYVSYPFPCKHVAFDGTLLHGCPHALATALGVDAPTEATADTAADTAAADIVAVAGPGGAMARDGTACELSGLRLTLLVNLWRRHHPLGPAPLPRRVAEALFRSAAESSHAPPARLMAERNVAQSEAPVVVPGSGHMGDSGAMARAGDSDVRTFAPSAKRRELSPAARTVSVRGLGNEERIVVSALKSPGATARVAHVPTAVVLAVSG